MNLVLPGEFRNELAEIANSWRCGRLSHIVLRIPRLDCHCFWVAKVCSANCFTTGENYLGVFNDVESQL